MVRATYMGRPRIHRDGDGSGGALGVGERLFDGESGDLDQAGIGVPVVRIDHDCRRHPQWPHECGNWNGRCTTSRIHHLEILSQNAGSIIEN